jgi:hypothetical protein
MANIDLKFLCSKSDGLDYIKVEADKELIVITGKDNNKLFEIDLDKSTAIKFAKTLRTEINKITESEVNNG